MSALVPVIIWLADPTPSLPPASTAPDDLVTPGVIGFVITFLVAVATVFLIIDMTRRIRRVRYREEIRAQLAVEQHAVASTPSALSKKRSPASTSALPAKPATKPRSG